MNTLSPKAKQAAEWIWKHSSPMLKPLTVEEMAAVIDAATAKLERQFAQQRELLEGCHDPSHAEKPDLENCDICRVIAHQQPSEEEQAETAAGMRQNKMWHQQPSATCPDCKQLLSGDDLVDREVHGRCSSQGEPSATTPDVEKIVFDLQAANLLKDESVDGLRRVETILSQARAALVKALKAWREFPHPIMPHCDECARVSNRAMKLTDAALTGTEEKR